MFIYFIFLSSSMIFTIVPYASTKVHLKLIFLLYLDDFARLTPSHWEDFVIIASSKGANPLIFLCNRYSPWHSLAFLPTRPLLFVLFAFIEFMLEFSALLDEDSLLLFCWIDPLMLLFIFIVLKVSHRGEYFAGLVFSDFFIWSAVRYSSNSWKIKLYDIRAR